MVLPQLTQPYTWTFRRVMGITLVIISVIFSFWILYRFNQVIFILLISILMGTVMRAPVIWLSQKGLHKIAGIILIHTLILITLIGFVLLLFPLIVEQSRTIGIAIPGYYQTVRLWMVNYPSQYILRLSEFLPVTLPSLLPIPIEQNGQEVIASAEQWLVYIKWLVKAVFITIVVLMLAFYWTLNGTRIIQSFLLLLPQDQREKIRELFLVIETKIGYYIIGQAFLCLIIGVLALFAYLWIGLPNAFLLALLAGVLEAVPMIGPLLGAIPAGLVALSIAPQKLIWVIVTTFVIQQLENSLLVPRVMRRAVGVNPFVTLLSLFAFSSLFGIAGALMAIPIAAIIQLLLNHFVFYPSIMDPEASAGRDYVSRLRYEAQDFAQDLRKQARVKKGGSDLRVKQIDQVMDEIETIATDLDTLLDSSASDSS